MLDFQGFSDPSDDIKIQAKGANPATPPPPQNNRQNYDEPENYSQPRRARHEIVYSPALPTVPKRVDIRLNLPNRAGHRFPARIVTRKSRERETIWHLKTE